MPHTEPIRSLMLQLMNTQFLFRQAVQRQLKACGIEMTFEMLQIMARIWRTEGMNQQTLAHQTSKDKVSLTYLINNLEKKGWVTRREDPQDKRNRLIYLTPEGRQLRERVLPLLEHVYAAGNEQTEKEHVRQCMEYLAELDEIFKKI